MTEKPRGPLIYKISKGAGPDLIEYLLGVFVALVLVGFLVMVI
jgi:hypothetical protein